MSGLPPVIDSAQPGTPSSEWARSTTTAALGRTEPAPAFSITNDNTSIPPTTGGVSVSSANDAQKDTFDAKTYHVAPTTPGSEFPGAYPPTPGERAGGLISADHVRETATNAATTAQSAAATAGGYIQSAATTAAGYLPQGVVDTVTSYIPSSTTTSTMSTARASEHDTEHKTSFPTREFSGASTGERTGGVGSLPGPLNEAAVTKLPHERVDDEKYMTAAAAATALAAGAYAAKDRVANALPSAQDAYDAKDRAIGSLPSTQSASQTLGQISQNTAQTVKSAAPAIPGVTSTTHSTAVTASTIPSRELNGAQPGDHSSGAGALPGFQDEPHVARLPEESANPQYDSGPIDNAAQAVLKPSQERFGNESATGDMRRVGGVGALVGGRDESGVALAPDERAGTAASTTGASRVLPSQEPLGNDAAGAPKKVGGVGALPGNFSESGVAVLPDARASTGTGTGTVTSPKTSTPAPAVPPKDEHKSADNGGEKNLKSSAGGTHGKPNEGPAYDTNYHPADLHPAPTNPTADSNSTSSKADDAESRPTESRHESASTKSETASPATKAKKAGFMDKMRGEAKVLLGKIEHKQEKVEAGQRMKAGEA